MFAVGHLSIGYLLAKGAARLLKQEINLPLIFVLTLIPDVDLLIPILEHRTITHSIIVTVMVFIPIFMLYKTKGIPYFVAVAQHGLIGDLITGGTYAGGTQLLWPITSATYGLPICISSSINVILEWSTFLVAMAVIIKTKDMQRLLKSRLSNLYLAVPTLTVLLPSLIHFPLAVPTELLIPHIVYLILFTLSIANTFRSVLSHSSQT